MRIDNGIVKSLVILFSVAGVTACYLKGYADGKIDADLRAVDGLLIGRYALKKVSEIDEEKKYEWAGSVLDSAANIVGGERPPSIAEIMEELEEAKRRATER